MPCGRTRPNTHLLVLSNLLVPRLVALGQLVSATKGPPQRVREHARDGGRGRTRGHRWPRLLLGLGMLLLTVLLVMRAATQRRYGESGRVLWKRLRMRLTWRLRQRVLTRWLQRNRRLPGLTLELGLLHGRQWRVLLLSLRLRRLRRLLLLLARRRRGRRRRRHRPHPGRPERLSTRRCLTSGLLSVMRMRA